MIEEIREEWKDIQGFEGRYKISNKGRVKALEKVVMKERILKPGNVNGYEAVNLYNEKHGRQTYSCKQCLEMLRLKINNVDKC